MTIFGLAVALELDLRNDAGAVGVRDVVADLPFEVMFAAEIDPGRRNRHAEPVCGLFFHAHFAGHIGERQPDAHGAGQRFDANLLVFRAGAKRAEHQ
jgi:hypothetical protein